MSCHNTTEMEEEFEFDQDNIAAAKASARIFKAAMFNSYNSTKEPPRVGLKAPTTRQGPPPVEEHEEEAQAPLYYRGRTGRGGRGMTRSKMRAGTASRSCQAGI